MIEATTSALAGSANASGVVDRTVRVADSAVRSIFDAVPSESMRRNIVVPSTRHRVPSTAVARSARTNRMSSGPSTGVRRRVTLFNNRTRCSSG